MKVLGAAFIFAFFSLIGIFRGGVERKKLAECEAFFELFEYVKNQVNYFLMPTKIIYRNFSNKLLEETGFLPALRSHEDDEIYCDVWKTSFKSSESRFHLSEKQTAIILGFGECVGKTNGQIQTNNFDYYISEMKNEIIKQKSETAKNIKLYRTLGMTAGALAAILII